MTRAKRLLFMNNSTDSNNTLVLATFSSADSTTSIGNADTGQAWDKSYCPTAVWGIRNGKLYLVSNTSGTPELVIDDGHISKSISLDFTYSSVINVIFRVANSTSYYYLLIGGGYLRLYKKISGTPTLLGQKAVTLTTGSTYTVIVEDTGTDITVYLDNALAFVANSTTDLNTYTTAGFRFHTSYDSVSEFDNYKVEVI